MDSSELASKMLAWEKLQREAAVLEAEIAAAVFELGKTYTVGNVRASYTKGRTLYDYEGTWRSLHSETEPDARYQKVIYDYKSALPHDASILIKSESMPSVTIKLME